jgi:dTDP-4-amino-4,6-dideoxygalactose transaminase
MRRGVSGRRSTTGLQPCFVYLGYLEGDLPEAERAAKDVLALPMFPELTEQEQRRVVDSVADFYC